MLAGCTSYWSDPSQWQTTFSADAAFCESQASEGIGSSAPCEGADGGAVSTGAERQSE
jgi:hypothetical protein